MSNSSDKLPPLPYIHGEDSFVLYLVNETALALRLTDIYMYRGNQNIDPVWISFYDLEPRVRDGILRQVGRKYQGRSVLV